MVTTPIVVTIILRSMSPQFYAQHHVALLVWNYGDMQFFVTIILWEMSPQFHTKNIVFVSSAMQILFSLGPSAVLFYYPSEGVWVIDPPFPYPPGTAHCPTLPTS